MATTDTEDPAIEADYLQEMESIEYIDPEVDDTTCSICHAEFLDSEDLTVHVNQVHKKKSAKTPKKSKEVDVMESHLAVCQFCDFTYNDADAYAFHILNKHLVKILYCRVCKKCFIDSAKWKRHEKKHNSKSNTYSCSQCTAIFSTPKEIEIHEAVKHDNNVDGIFLSCMPQLSALLKQNANAYIQSNDRELTCAACKFTSPELFNYVEHSDPSCVVYVCDKCCHVSSSKKNLIKHFGRKRQCSSPKECYSEFTICSNCKARVHCKKMLTHLAACNKYKCHVCDIRFISIESLSKHQTEVHPVELDVIRCKFCFKEFVGQDSLDKHMKRSHSHQFILYKYKCLTCEQIFKHPQLLFAHYFTKHKDLEPYTCRICDKKFKVRKRFTIHIKMEHKSAGVVEFDEQYHVFFAEKKSENPFIPKCVIPELVPPDSPAPTIKVKTQKEINAEISNSEMPTETEIDEENKDNIKKPKQRGRKRKVIKAELSSSEEEEAAPLSMIKKRAERKHFRKLFPPGSKKINQHLSQRKQFTCKTCNKYCYTYQNYHNHIQIHKKENIKCIKCSKIFKSKSKLSEHMAKNHTTSKLIETLKNVLERKQFDNNDGRDRNEEDLTPSERFMKTIKRVRSERQTVAATIAPAGNLSVKNFIENFVPEVGENANVESTVKNDSEEPIVILKHYDSPFYRKHAITMTKFVPEPPQTSFKLKMPEKFKTQPVEKVKLRVRLVQEPIKVSMFDQLESFQTKFSHTEDQDYDDGGIQNDHTEHTDHHDDHDDHYEHAADDIPEVAEEVMLEGSDEPPKLNLQAPHKIVIPKLPDGYPKIHIATLQPQAPFFKIITVKNSKNENEAIVIDTDTTRKVKKERDSYQNKDVISLPDGTKFVTTNPLAHLLGGKPVEDLQVSTKYYKPTPKNFKGLFAEALQNLDKPSPKSKKPRKKVDIQIKLAEGHVAETIIPDNEVPEDIEKGPGKSLPLL